MNWILVVFNLAMSVGSAYLAYQAGGGASWFAAGFCAATAFGIALSEMSA